MHARLMSSRQKEKQQLPLVVDIVQSVSVLVTQDQCLVEYEQGCYIDHCHY